MFGAKSLTKSLEKEFTALSTCWSKLVIPKRSSINSFTPENCSDALATASGSVLTNFVDSLTTAGTITAGKYYLKNPNYQTAASPSTSADPAPARSLAIVKGETTGVIQLTNDEAVEGFNDVWYTIDGQKLDKKPTRKGIYIQNGKKLIVK